MTSSKITPLTEEEMKGWPKNPLVNLEKPFVDLRGSIQPLVDSIMKSAVMIHSKAGSLRANHYHKTDWHFIYVIKGEFEYYFRKTNSNEDTKKKIVTEGQLLFTGPMIDHAMLYTKETEILVVSKNPRDQKTYEEDTVRIDFMNHKNRF